MTASTGDVAGGPESVRRMTASAYRDVSSDGAAGCIRPLS